jgi:hypothetical protein
VPLSHGALGRAPKINVRPAAALPTDELAYPRTRRGLAMGRLVEEGIRGRRQIVMRRARWCSRGRCSCCPRRRLAGGQAVHT